MDRCLRLVDGGGTGGDEMYARLGMLTFDRVYEYFCLARTYRYRNLGDGHHFQSQYAGNSVQHGVDTRFRLNQNINLPQIHSSKYLNSFLINSIKFWNTIPSNVKQSKSLSIFKKYLKTEHFNIL